MTEPAVLTIRSMIALSMPLLMGFPAMDRSGHRNSWTRQAGCSASRASCIVSHGQLHAVGASETGSRIQWPKARV